MRPWVYDHGGRWIVGLGASLLLGWLIADSPATGAEAKPPAGAKEAAEPAPAKPAGPTFQGPPKKPAADPADETEPAAPVKPAKPAAKPAPARQYKSLPVTDTLKRSRGDVMKFLREGAIPAGQEAVFDDYYNKYSFPRWTVAQNYSSIPDYRKEIRVELMGGKSGAVYDRLIKLTVDFMTKAVADKDLHPAVRYNAMLCLADLNAQEPPPGPQRKIVPIPEVTTLMLQALKAPDQIDAVRVAALQGLVRHAHSGGLENQVRDGQVIPALLEIANAKTPPAGRTPEGHAWMRALAVDALAGFHTPGANDEVVKALLEIIKDTTAPMHPTRLAAARALGYIDLQGAKTVKPKDVVLPLAQLAFEACTTELKREIKVPGQAALPAGGMYGPGGPGPGSGMRPPRGSSSGPGMYGPGGMVGEEEEKVSDERSILFRRRLKTCLAAVQTAIAGADRNAPYGLRSWVKAKPDEPLVDLFGALVDDQIKILSDADADLETLRNKVIVERKKLKKALDGPDAAVAEHAKTAAAEAAKKKPAGAKSETPPAPGGEAPAPAEPAAPAGEKEAAP